MKATVDQNAALEALAEEKAGVQRLVDELSRDALVLPAAVREGLFPGQQMSAKDLVAHLAMWQDFALQALDEWASGKRPWITDPRYATFEGSRDLNLGGDEKKRDVALDVILDEWRETEERLAAAIRRLTDAEWRSAAPYEVEGRVELGGLLEDVLTAPGTAPFRHLPNHVPDLDEFIERVKRESRV